MSKIAERFMEYVRMDTQSAETDCFPSTEKQKDLARLLARQLREMGASDVRMDETYGYVYATLPSTLPEGKTAPTIGFIAHMDTAYEVPGGNVIPRMVKDYDGGDILLNEKENIWLKPAEYPGLSAYKGKDLIVTDGTTLLGADDKAGVAEIMEMAKELLCHREIPHGKIRIAFTPDEEVGRGVDFFDVKGFGADFAYTVDGGTLGEIEYENFNAASAVLTVFGVSAHPGTSRGCMKNAILLAQEFQTMLPVYQNPACTDGYEGFFHPNDISGGVERVDVHYIIRDHDKKKFEEKKQLFARICAFLNEKYGGEFFTAKITDTYYNMKEQILPHFHLIENAKEAMETLGITPRVIPIRGGTDGARLSFMGLPCPNLCTGGENFHSRREYICVQSMESMTQVLLEIARRYGER